MADSAIAPETATAVDPKATLYPPESNARPGQSDPSSAANPQFSNPSPSVVTPSPPMVQPSFRPAAPPVLVPSSAVATAQFAPLAFQAPGVPHSGVVVASGPAVGIGPPPQASSAPVHPVMGPPYAVAGQPMRFAAPMPNGYLAMPPTVPQGAMPPPVYS